MSEHDTLYDAGGRWRRWEMESFDPAPEPQADAPASADSAQPALPDPAEVLAEIERLREAARARGHAEGFAKGHAQGHEAGYKEGREQGLTEGREAGRAQGRKEGLQTARSEAEALQRLATACAESISSIEAETGDALVSLALRVAEQVLRSTLQTEPERILDLIRDVVHVDGAQQGVLKIRLNPEDMDLVDQYLQTDATVNQWRLQSDPSIERGGCIVETALGNIDATLATRWQRVASTLGEKV